MVGYGDRTYSVRINESVTACNNIDDVPVELWVTNYIEMTGFLNLFDITNEIIKELKDIIDCINIFVISDFIRIFIRTKTKLYDIYDTTRIINNDIDVTVSVMDNVLVLNLFVKKNRVGRESIRELLSLLRKISYLS